MTRFSLSQLECLVAVCETGSISLAAERQHLSPSTVSTTITSLERRLGVTLLIRHHARGVTPTAAGLRLLREAKSLLQHAVDVDRLASDLEGEVTGDVDVGCLVTVAPIVMPRLWRSFEARYESVTLRLTEAGHDELLVLLQGGAISTALTYPLHVPGDVAFDPLLSLKPVALLSPSHPLTRKKRVTVRDLSREPLLLLDLPMSREYFMSLFAAAGVTPRIRHRSRHLDLIRGMVANGFGYSIVTAQAVGDQALDGERIATVPISGDPATLQLGLITVAGTRRPRAVDAFHAFCRESSEGGVLRSLLGPLAEGDEMLVRRG